MYSVGLGGYQLTLGVPVLQEFYEMYVRCGVPCSWKEENPYRFGNKIRTISNAKRTPEVRASFYVAFGVLPHEQVMLEKFFGRSGINWDILPLCHRDDVVFDVPGCHLTNYDKE